MKRSTLKIDSKIGEYELKKPLKGRVIGLVSLDLDIGIVIAHTNDAKVDHRWFVVRKDPCDLSENERYLGCVGMRGTALHVFEIPFKVVRE